jgi:hypothetical protein
MQNQLLPFGRSGLWTLISDHRPDLSACTIAVAPTPLICVDRLPRSDQWGQWSFAHGLFAALDLAQDRARGAEILESWNPKEFARIW